jgi:hypothetical protein
MEAFDVFDAFGTRRKAFLVSKVIFVLNTLTVIKHRVIMAFVS